MASLTEVRTQTESVQEQVLMTIWTMRQEVTGE